MENCGKKWKNKKHHISHKKSSIFPQLVFLGFQMIRFSKYLPTEDDLIFDIPLILERDYKGLRAALQEPCPDFPKKYNAFLTSFREEEGETRIRRIIDTVTAIAPGCLTRGIYIPRHYTMLDTLYNVYRQIAYINPKIIIPVDVVVEEEPVEPVEPDQENQPPTEPAIRSTINTRFYHKMTELVNALINNPRMTQKTGAQEQIKGFSHLWKGKGGIIRNTILGKRTGFNGRSVIVPDPSLKIDQIKLPLMFRDQLTTDHVWTADDKSYLYNDIRWVEFTAPSVGTAPSTPPQLIPYKLWLQHYGEIPMGTVVHRTLRVGDWVLVNRQPSLRLQNILYLEIARFGDPDDHTIGINLAVTEGFGADFDGDEMNIFVPQSQTTRNVCMERLTPQDNMIDLGTGTPIWAHVQDVAVGTDYLGLDNQSILRGLGDGSIPPETYQNLQHDAYTASTGAGFSISFFDLLGPKDVTEPDPYGNWSRMIRTGAKGKQLNLDQMCDGVGLLLVNGRPVPEVNHITSGKGGVIVSNYSKGLTFGECVQHAMAAWEAMITSAVQTAQSGYRGRIMNYALMNLTEQIDGTENRIGLQTAIILGQTLTQSQLSSFHATGQEKLRSSLADTVAWIEARKGGPANKMLLTNDAHVLYSFKELGGKFTGKYLVFPMYIAEAYNISTGEDLDFHVVGQEHMVSTPYGEGMLVDVLDHGRRATVSVGTVLLHTGHRSLTTRSILTDVEVMVVPDEDFIEWYVKQTPDKVLKILYSDYVEVDGSGEVGCTGDSAQQVICSDVALVEKIVGWQEAKKNLGVLLSCTAFGKIKPKYVNVLVDALFAQKTYSSVTRHGNLYKSMGVVAQALMECPYTRFKEAADANMVDPMNDVVDDLFFSC